MQGLLLLILAALVQTAAFAADLTTLRSYTFNYPASDVAWDGTRGRLYVIDAARAKVIGIRLSDGVADQEFNFSRAPETMAIRPDGQFLYVAMPTQPHNSYWFDAHTGYVGEVNLETATKTREWQIDADPYDILATDAGWIIVPDGSGQWTDVAIYKAGESTRAGRGFIRQMSHVALHPAQNKFYSADTDSSPSDIMAWRFNPADGTITGGVDSPYHGDHPMGGNVFVSADGKSLVTAGGGVYTSSDTPEQDMRYVTTLSSGSVRAAHFDTLHKTLFTSGAGSNWENPSPTLTCYSANYEPLGQWNLTNSIAAIHSDTNQLYLALVRPDKTTLAVFANPAAGAETNAAPVSRFTISPDAPTTRTTIALDASATTDDESSTNLLYRWDFEADGAWDVAFTNKATAQVRYNLAGSKTIRLEVMDRYGATSRLEKTIDVPFEADPGTPGGTNLAFQIPFTPADVAADLGRFRLFATDSANKKLIVLNLTNGFIERQFTLDYTPESIAISPNGSNLYVTEILRPHSAYWFTSETGYVAQFDLATLTKIREVRIDNDPSDIVATDNGILAVSGGSDQWTEISIIEGATGRRIDGVMEYMGTRLALHPSQNAFYSSDVGLSPTDYSRISFDPNTGVKTAVWDSPYHGDYAIVGQPYPTPDGRYIISPGGVVLTSSPDASLDLRFVRNLELGGFAALDFDTANKAFFTVGASWNSPNSLRYYNENFELVRSEPLTNEYSRIFASAEKLWLVGTQNGNTIVTVRPNPALGALSNVPPKAEFTFTPTAPSTLDYIDFNGGSSTDETKSTLLYRWDWQADGTYDTEFSSNPVGRFRFIGEGSHTVRLQIKDAFGALDEVEHSFNVTAGFDSGTAITGAQTAFQLPFAPRDVAFDPNSAYMYALDQNGKRLVSVNLETGLMEREFKFDAPPEAITITPNGSKMYVALLGSGHGYWTGGTPHYGYVAEFTLAPLGKTREMELPIDPADIVANDAGQIIISDGSDQWTQIACFDAATGAKLGSLSSVYMGMRLALHPNQTIVYGTDIGLSPSDIHHFDISSSGGISGGWDSPYHGDYPLGGEVFIFPDASGVFSPAGVVLTSSPLQTGDLRYIRTMPVNGIADVAFDEPHKVMAAVSSSKLTFYNYDTNKVIVERAIESNGSFVGMRNGRAAVVSTASNGAKISFYRIPATTLAENVAPIVTLNSPTNGAVVSVGSVIPVDYYANDEDGDVTSVRVYDGDKELSFSAGTITLTNAGIHDLYVVARDNFNVASTSQVAHVTASFAPTVAITEPTQDALFTSPEFVRITAQAADQDGSVTTVRLFDNGQVIRTLTSAPYSYDLPITGSGIHNVYAEAVDNLGLKTQSTTVRFIVGGLGADNLTSDLVVLTGMRLTLQGLSVDATHQKYEPVHAGNGGGKSLWWAWRAPTNGLAMLSTAGSDFDTLLAVYTWPNFSSLQSLVPVASNDDDANNPPTSHVKFRAVQNTVYYIAVDGRDGVGGSVTLDLAEFAVDPAVPNDNLLNATPTLINRTNLASNIGATHEASEPTHAGNSGGGSVWWSFRPTDSSLVEISTEGSDFDTLLAVYNSSTSMAGLRLVASNDDADSTHITSKLVFQPTPFSTYVIAVDGYGGAMGNIRLVVSRATVTQNPPPANDNFANATVISGSASLTTTSSTTATREINEPLHAGQTGGRSLWWSWTAPADGPVYVSTRTSSIDTVLAVYTGTALSSLTAVASNDDDPAGFRTSALFFQATAGTRYYIAVDGYNGVGGSIVLALNHSPTLEPHIVAQFADGKFQISSEGAVGTMSIEKSADLVTWETIQTATAGEMVEIPQAPAIGSSGTAFYRLKITK